MTKLFHFSVCLLFNTFLCIPLFAGGFQIQEQGARALALAGTFTARPGVIESAFYNPAGLASLRHSQFQLGGDIMVPSVRFSGINPYPGYGISATQVRRILSPASLFAARPFHSRLVIAFAVTTPYAERREWRDPFQFSGRYIAMKSELWHLRAALTVGYAFSRRLALGFGLFTGLTYLEQDLIYPVLLGGRVFDAAHVNLSGTSRPAAGWQAGLQYRAGDAVTLGVAFSSGLTVKFQQQSVRWKPIRSGETKLDDALQLRLPARQRFSSELMLPATLAFGVSIRPLDRIMVGIDWVLTRWQVFRGQNFIMDDTTFSLSRPAEWRNTGSWRIGIEFAVAPSLPIRLGYAFDPTPQPEETVSPLWVDGSRHLFSTGLGIQIADFTLDAAIQLGFYESRRVLKSNYYQFYGEYALFLFRSGLSVTYRF